MVASQPPSHTILEGDLYLFVFLWKFSEIPQVLLVSCESVLVEKKTYLLSLITFHWFPSISQPGCWVLSAHLLSVKQRSYAFNISPYLQMFYHSFCILQMAPYMHLPAYCGPPYLLWFCELLNLIWKLLSSYVHLTLILLESSESTQRELWK